MLYRKLRGAACSAAILAATPVQAQLSADAADPMPAAPAIVAPSYTTPVRDADGYRTPNRALSAEQTSWHVRVALNVAALGCRGAGEEALAAAYNAMLSNHGATLAAAMAGAQGRYRATAGAAWQARYDDDMTRLYNFWAQTPAHGEFCAVAAELLRQSGSVAPGGFGAFAATALPQLEAPFTRFYAAFDTYRTALAAWHGRHPAPLVIAAVAPAPVAMMASPEPPAVSRLPAGPGEP